jgi:hypothetical protein
MDYTAYDEFLFQSNPWRLSSAFCTDDDLWYLKENPYRNYRDIDLDRNPPPLVSDSDDEDALGSDSDSDSDSNSDVPPLVSDGSDEDDIDTSSMHTRCCGQPGPAPRPPMMEEDLYRSYLTSRLKKTNEEASTAVARGII